jgi:type I restriction-modification system DNA methylase subunit
MDSAQLNWITNFIWGIADDCLRDIFVRGKYRDVILPMTVLRRLDAVLEPTKAAVLEMKAALDTGGIVKIKTTPFAPPLARLFTTPRLFSCAILNPARPSRR